MFLVTSYYQNSKSAARIFSRGTYIIYLFSKMQRSEQSAAHKYLRGSIQGVCDRENTECNNAMRRLYVFFLLF